VAQRQQHAAADGVIVKARDERVAGRPLSPVRDRNPALIGAGIGDERVHL